MQRRAFVLPLESLTPMPDTPVATHQALHTQLTDGILTISLHAPTQGNALSPDMLFSLDELFKRLSWREDVRAVVLRGTDTQFSSGLDVEDFSRLVSHDLPRARAALDCLHQWRSRLFKIQPQPIIGMVVGACHGAAVKLMEACDLVLAAENAEFMLTAADAALLACHPPCVPGPAWMQASAWAEWAVPGLTFSGAQAESNGLITLACSPDTLETDVYDLARSLVEKDPLALQFTKETVAHVDTMSWDAAVNFTAAKFAELKSRQAGGASARASGVQNFLAGKSKPGLGG